MYMVHQRVTTAVREGYREADDAALADELAKARATLAWLERLQIDAGVRAGLVEPIEVIEEALAELARRRG